MSFAFPPRQMRAPAAAYYCGLSETAFLERVKRGEYPAGVLDGGARVWLRDDLDAAIDRRFGVLAANDAVEASPFKARLAERRA